MLHSCDLITINHIEYEVRTYLKKTRNYSYRIIQNKITISLPQQNEPHEILLRKSEWLNHAIDRIEKDPKFKSAVSLINRAQIYIAGHYFQIKLDPSVNKDVYDQGTNTFIFRYHIESKMKLFLKSYIQKNYTDWIQDRVAKINAITLKQEIQSIQLKHHISKWGSCSSKKEITISQQTLLAPLWVIDYVIVHELCHLVEMNHGKSFWHIVSKFYPQYKLAIKYLKEHSQNLSL